jgi:hypothetical protein
MELLLPQPSNFLLVNISSFQQHPNSASLATVLIIISLILPSCHPNEILFFFWWYWGLNSEPCEAGASPFCFSYFWNRVWLLNLGWPGPLPSYLCSPSSLDDKCAPPHPTFYWLKWGLSNCPIWPRTLTLPISAC